MRRVSERPLPEPEPAAGLRKPLRWRWRFGLILVLAAIAASQVWIWTAKRPTTDELAAIVDTYSRDPLGVRVRYLLDPERDEVVLATESSEGALRVYISPGPEDRDLRYPNIAGQGGLPRTTSRPPESGRSDRTLRDQRP